jgi:thiamine-monophosphate kinase
MIDVSDGLVADAGHLAAASDVRCVVQRDRVPVHPAAEPAQALVGGEEYELLVTLPAGTGEAVAAACMAEHGVPLTRIGTVAEGTGVRVEEDGVEVETPLGFSHL